MLAIARAISLLDPFRSFRMRNIATSLNPTCNFPKSPQQNTIHRTATSSPGGDRR
jgi:hypothetical protein